MNLETCAKGTKLRVYKNIYIFLKKPLNVTQRKNRSIKNRVGFEGQVTYWEGTVKDCSTSLSSKY